MRSANQTRFRFIKSCTNSLKVAILTIKIKYQMRISENAKYEFTTNSIIV